MLSSASSESTRYCGVCTAIVVDDAVLRVEPERRRRLRAARRARSARSGRRCAPTGPSAAAACGPSAGRPPGCRGAGARARRPRRGSARIFLTSSAASAALAAMFVAGELHVDRRRQAEVEDLRDDVGRLEEELDAGEALRQLGAQQRHELLGRAGGPSCSDSRISPSSVPMVPALLYERLMPLFGTPRLSRMVSSWSVGISSRIAASTCVGDARGLLDAGAGRRAQVQADLAGVDAREEVAAEHRVEAAREQRRRRGRRARSAPRLREQRRRAVSV